MRYVVGAILIAIPFVAEFVLSVRLLGWKATLAIYVVCLSAVALIVAGVYLIGAS